jgi:type IV pilus assembly protein PilV
MKREIFKPMIIDRQAGFTLIEVMISAVILAIGLLALSGMQALSFSRNVDANELTIGTNLAADVMERIQFNRKNVTAYSGIDTSVACTIAAGTQPMARGDCDQWRNLLSSSYAANLNSIRGRVTISPTGPAGLNQSSVSVLMTWTGVVGASKTAKPRQIIINSVVSPE